MKLANLLFIGAFGVVGTSAFPDSTPESCFELNGSVITKYVCNNKDVIIPQAITE